MKKSLMVFMVVFISFALTLGFGLKSAEADSILFPYLAVQPGVFSFVTIANEGLNEFATATGYHFSYGYKPVPVDNDDDCLHYDANVTTTPADIMTFEISGTIMDDPPSIVLFESAAPVTSTAAPMLGAVNDVGFLIVEPLGNDLAAEIVTRIEVYGWADVIDTTANMSLSYSSHGLGSNNSVNPDFSVSNVGNTWHRWAWMPELYVTTSWYVLPVGTRAAMTPAVGGGIAMTVEASNGALDGAYDRDEAFHSGSSRETLTCLGIVARSAMLQPGALAATINGGFMYAESFTAPASQHLVYRIQAAEAAAGVGVRQAINREPALNPQYDITLDVGP